MFLCHHKGKGRGSHPKLCRRHKEEVPGISYLHGLASEKADAGISEGMGGIAETALHPAYDKGDLSQCCFYGAGIGPVPCEAAAVAAGTLQLADLDGIHGIIIKFL